ncbi:uncharacterized protein PF3D7_1120000-like [Microplitis mediator]|uniref:uncharacterized protein PF3D7_1120000-like n=1 Tax=Microplitis mediator TaxID=375433 RepID=UPI0025561904|nr:uncharacterized protein PF3D7_1120000-like [Microplitis mediator]
MKNNIAFYLIIILVILSLNFHGCLTDNLRSKKSLKSLTTHEKFFGHKKNPREINENLYDDVEGKENEKKINKINHSDGKKNLLRKKRDREDREVLKRQAELEVTKTELEELQRKIENEIVSLKNRYKSSRVNRQNDDSKMISNPRLVKIEVDTYEIDSPPADRHNQNIKKREDISTTIKSKVDSKNFDFSVPKERRMISDDKSQINNPEDELGSKIEAIKKNFKDQIDFEKRNNEIGKSNDKFEEIKNLYTGKCARNDAEKSVKKRSAGAEGKNKFKRHAGIKKIKKSVSENISIKNNQDLDSNLITSESKIKNSLREKRKTSHHEKSKSKKDTLHKNKHDNKVVKKSVSNKDNKLKLSVGNLSRGKRNKQAHKKANAHKIKERDRPKHLHKRQYNRWDTVERDERSVDTVDNKNSNAEAESDDGLDVLNSQDNAPIASEYKESFGGFPNDPADALNRYKRIKRYKS